MTENQLMIVSNAQQYVTDVYNNKVNKSIRFHNLDHTQGVVLAAEEMAHYFQLQDEDHAVLLVAAWFHDTGFSTGEAKGHEDASIGLATNFLKEQKANEAFIQKVKSTIEATKMPQTPHNLIEQILCDADLYHLGTDEFKEKSKRLRDELTVFSKKDISKKQWRKINIRFLDNHEYFTDYARRKLSAGKQKNYEELKDPEKETKKKKKALVTNSGAVNASFPKNVQEGDKIKKDDKTDRQASTVFRIMASNHANLSQMADSKANILISVNSIILTIIISVLLGKLDQNTNLIYPTIILLIVCVSAIVFSILATRPNVSEGRFTREDIQNKETNLLFFGNFHRMSLPDYDWAMTEMLADKQYLYSSMIKDNYFLGVVLARKYKFLRISYSIFMYGIIVSVLAFAAALLFPDSTPVYVPG